MSRGGGQYLPRRFNGVLTWVSVGEPERQHFHIAARGDYRVIFWLDTSEIVQLQFTYKGKLMIDGIFIHHTGY